MNDRRIDLAPLAGAALLVLVGGVVLGRALLGVLCVAIGLLAGLAIGSPVGAAALTLVVVFLLVVAFGGPVAFAAGAALVAAASAVVWRRRPAVARVARRVVTGGTGAPLGGLSAWAFIAVPLAAAGATWLVPPPGEVLGLSGTPRHVVTGLSGVAMLVLAGAFVARRARAVGASRAHAVVWGVVSAAMSLLWAFGIFIAMYVLNPPSGG
jgi:hypothetical protein